MLKKSGRRHLCGADTAVGCSALSFVVCVCLLGFVLPSWAAVVATGDVDPADPTTWTSSTYAYIGKDSDGTLNITDDSDVFSMSSFIGYKSGSTGVVNVDGAGTQWQSSHGLFVGIEGCGTLNITNGAWLQSSWSAWSSDPRNTIGGESASTGMITVDGADSTWKCTGHLSIGGNGGNGVLNITNNGEVIHKGGYIMVSPQPGSLGAINFNNGTLTTDFLMCATDNLTGTGTINAGGLLCDIDLVFDTTHGLSQSFSINDNPGQNITVNLDIDDPIYTGAGYDNVGTMRISDGMGIESYEGYIGYKSGSDGEVTVDGSGSMWTNTFKLKVGYYGNGKLNITNGGAMNVGEHTWVAEHPGSSGEIHFDGGTLNTNDLLCAADDLTGTGTVNTRGLLSDVDLVFDATHGFTQNLSINDNPNQNVTINLNSTNADYLGAGYSGAGTMNIADAVVVRSEFGWIGMKAGSTGEVTVAGVGSMWINSLVTLVGASGNGSLNITDGGEVSNRLGYIGNSTGSTSEVMVNGVGLKWTNSDSLNVGHYGNGTLSITHGGLVSVAETLTIDFDEDGDSFINMSTGGMLALYGDGDDSLADFLGMVEGTDAIQYWDDSVSDWADIAGATYGRDYTLEYLTGGELDGYTLLTVERAVDGDATLDGVVDEYDAAVLADNWLTASGAGWEMGDFNDDGAVDEIDATILAANWQCGVDEVVPEPSAICGLLGICLAGVLGRWRFGRRELICFWAECF